MLDIPADVSVALDVLKALNASGRCREDADLYAAAASLVKSYLDAANDAHSPPPAATTVAGVAPRRAA